MRWCWIGDKRTPDNNENPGHFGIIRLYDQSAFARQDIIWYDYVIRRGPIYSRTGQPDRQDWDGKLYPFLSLRLDGSRASGNWHPHHVFSNGFVNKQMRTMCPQWVLDSERYKFLLQKGVEADDALTDAARQRADEFEHSIRFNPNYVLIDKAEIKQAVKDAEAADPNFDPRGPQFKEYFVEKFGSHLRTKPE
jgi:hypothetical protein